VPSQIPTPQTLPPFEGLDQPTIEYLTDDASSDVHAAVVRSDEGESSDQVELEQAQPPGDEEYDMGPSSGNGHTEQPVGVIPKAPWL